jgi:2-oxo-4-hydroxy-4-carboxy-5-ureidoimidazoline decarboxylase
MTIAEVNRMDEDGFVATFGGIFEHSPWVAQRAFSSRPFSSLEDLFTCLNRAVGQASVEEKLALLREHPDLGTRAEVSAVSASEQVGAGLDRLTQDENDLLTALNDAYRTKFGFPFLYAVRGGDKDAILRALQLRSENTPEVEFREALNQVFRIARFRLGDLCFNSQVE